MKKVLSIISAAALLLLAGSCVKEKFATVDISGSTAPVLLSSQVGDDEITASYTPAVFKMDFNEKMPVYHSFVMVSLDGKDVNKALSSRNENNTLTLTSLNLNRALMAMGCQDGDVVSCELVIRASVQSTTYASDVLSYIDSEGRIKISNHEVTEPKGSPYIEYTEASDWTVTGALSAYGISWDGDLNMWTDGTNHVAAHVTLKAGDEFKFRKDLAWTENMGGEYGGLDNEFAVAQDGANIVIDADGVYDLFLNPAGGIAWVSAAFDPYPDYTEVSNWSVIGALSEHGINWDGDLAMITDGTWHVATGVTLTAEDEFKFRQDKAWTVNMGGEFGGLDNEFAVTQDGANIVVGAAGVYDLFVNPDAGLAKVTATTGAKISSVVGGDEPPAPAVTGWNIIGLNGDWDNDVIATQNGSKWTVYATVADATEFKWRKDGAWDEDFGGTFVTAGEPFEAVSGGSNISIGPGFWEIVLDTEALTITISEGNVYSLIGEINGDSWTKDVFMTEKNGVWTSVTVSIEGGFKIRHNCSWADADVYGAEEGFTAEPGVAFTAVQPGGNISVEPGQYKVTFNPETREVLIGESKYPEHLYMIGAEFGGWDWNSDGVVEMTPVLHNPEWGAEAEGQFWTVRYFTAGQGFKFCSQRAWDGDFWGLTYNDGFTEEGGNCTVSEDGFYLVHIDFKNEKVHVEPARIYGIGEAFGGWDEEKEENLFKADGKTLKATLPKAGNLRMYAASSISTSGWWTREFDLFDGKIVYRLMDELAAVPAKAGQVVVLDFNAGTGEITGEGEAPAYKTEISVPGAYSGSEWDLDTAPKLLGKGDGEFKGALVMYKQGDAAVEFKFGHDGSWIGGTADGLNYTLGAGDNMTIEEGTYFWTVNLESKTATALKVEKVGLIGSFNEWSDDVVLTFNAEDHTYNGTVTLGENAELKVRFNGNWDYSLGGDLNRLQAVNDNCKVAEAGTYTAKLDLNKGTLTLTK